MNSTWVLNEKSQGELKVVCDGEAWQQAQTKAFNKLAKSVKIDGFREGQAPMHLVKKQIKEQGVLVEAVEMVATDLLLQGCAEHSLDLVARPELGIDSLTNESAVLTFKCVTKPVVVLGDYKSVSLPKVTAEVSESEIDAQIVQIRQNFAELVVKETGAVELGDTAVIDFEGFLNEVAFEGGKGENYPLEIGSNSFIPGFEEQVLGMNTGEQKDLLVRFPDQYQAEHLAGQPVVFKVEVKEIKQKTLPEADDELAKMVNVPDITSLAELRQKIHDDLLARKQHQADDERTNKLVETVAEQVTIEIPDVMISEEQDYLYRDFVSRMEQQNYTEELYYQVSGQTKEQLMEQFAGEAAKKVKVRLVLEAIAKAEQLTVSDEALEAEYISIADHYKMELAKVKELLPVTSLSADLLLRNAMNLLLAQ
jgi:trigger factor